MMKIEESRPALSWREEGSGDALLLLHAFPLSSAMWGPQLSALGDEWRVIAPDFAGFGDSPSRSGGGASMDAYADDVASLLDTLEIEQAVVCGLSMGGYAAFAMQRRHPGRIRALVLCDTRPGPDTEAMRQNRRELVKRVRLEGMQPLVDNMLPRLLSPNTRYSRPDVTAHVEGMMRTVPPETAAGALIAMANRPDSTPLLRDINVPTLIVVGADDETTPPGESQMLARGIRGARLEILMDAGHLSSIEQPVAFNALLRSFLAGLPSAVQSR
jgi:pimeloyl-ACP methyl ester carboxylesterase